MREVGRHELAYKVPVRGTVFEVELITGAVVRVFRGDDGEFYFCHGLTFGGKDAPGGPVSGPDVTTILAELFRQIVPEANAVEGDVLVWYDSDGFPVHSAIVRNAQVELSTLGLHPATIVQTKNGKLPERIVMLEQLIDGPDGYGESYRAYHRK